MALSVVIVGAGAAGLSCGRRLVDGGATVTVFEKGGQPGGRLATRRTELGGFDHGVQYFTARDEAFSKVVDSWVAAGAAQVWNPKLSRRSPSDSATAGATTRYVGVPGMSAIGSALAAGLDVRLGQAVRSLDAVGGEDGRRWAIKRVDDLNELDAIEVTEGLFDIVVLAAPAPASAELLANQPELAREARKLVLKPAWALMLAFAEPLATPFDARFVDGPRLKWIARDSSKPSRRSGERWVAHASTAWSAEHLEDDPEDVRAKMLTAFMQETGSTSQPIHSAVHRWRFAMPSERTPEGFLWSPAAHVGACGDWCSGARVEDAWMSGRALAERILGN